MNMKITLAAFACSGTLLALLPISASAAPVSGVGQSRGVATPDNPLLQKVHRWWRRGLGRGTPLLRVRLWIRVWIWIWLPVPSALLPCL